MHKRKRTSNDLQTTTQKTEDRVTRTTLKFGDEHKCFGRVSSSRSTSGTCSDALASSQMMSHKWGEGLDCGYDKWNISVVMFGTRYSVTANQVMMKTT
jgi:hypothetical protein